MSMSSICKPICLIGLALAASVAQADDRERQIHDMLSRFQADPNAVLGEIPMKWDMEGHPIDPADSIFPEWSIAGRDFVDLKYSYETGSSPSSELPGAMFSHIIDTDGPQPLVEELGLMTLEDIEAASLTGGKAENAPWSGDYWPLSTGMIAKRYADPLFPESADWKKNVDYILGHRDASSVGYLSPAEKYDLLVGDTERTLTQYALDQGKRYYDESGSVDGWMGICHGWAPASFEEMRPEKTVQVLASDGKTRIPFFPSDLKALASLLWAKGHYTTAFVGTRCDMKNPRTDENGRILSQACFDENPGAWHLALINELGLKKRPFIIDANYDYQVWNQPLLSYRYSYFNPQTGQPVGTLSDAGVSRAEFTADKFKKYRAPEAASMVGIALDLTYVVETRASTESTDSPERDRFVTVRYLYDVELDASSRIIGGEWYQNAHPDFLWAPASDAKAESSADAYLDNQNERESWDVRLPLPESWRSAAIRGSREGMPLAHIVKGLIVLSRISAG